MEKKRILIADDDESFLTALALRLENEGFEVLTAKNTYDALERAMRQRLDVIITDINMPGGDGFNIQERLEDFRGDAPPIIYVTGEKSGHMARVLWQSDAQKVFYKPLDTQALLQTINDELAES